MASSLTDYQLQATSPMRKTGQNLSYWSISPGSYDFYGNGVSGSWAGIGAHTPNVASTQNYIANNPGFETGTLANWSTWSDGYGWNPWVSSYNGSYEGTYHLVHQQGGARSHVQSYQSLTNIPNGTYTLTAWMWGSGWSNPSYGGIAVHGFDAGDTYLYAWDNPAGDSGWTQYTINNICVYNSSIVPFVDSSLLNQWLNVDAFGLTLVGPIYHN